VLQKVLHTNCTTCLIVEMNQGRIRVRVALRLQLSWAQLQVSLDLVSTLVLGIKADANY
jgi:hypothetical protein